MAVIRWEPARELQSLQNEVNRLFSTVFDSPTAPNGAGAQARRWIPPMDLVETDSHFVLHADLPGVSEDDVKIEVEANVLEISGERRSEHTEKRDGYYRVERASGAFSRSLTLPEGIDAGAIEARFDRGVLEVRIPKPAERRPRRVEINVAGSPPVIDGGGSDAPAAEPESASAPAATATA